MNMIINSESEMLALGRKFAGNLTFPAVFELIGDVGAGKTTFTRGLAEGLGVNSPVTSPSFTISKRYAFPITADSAPASEPSRTNGTLIHYDFYRLDDPGIMREELSEALSLPNAVIIVEWGGDVADLLPEHKIRIEFSLTADGARELKISAPTSFQVPASSRLSSDPQTVPANSQAVHKAQIAAKLSDNSNVTANRPAASDVCELYLDTSTDLCRLKINDHEYTWDSGRVMAEQIFTFIHNKLAENNFDWPSITKITYFSGPGSFTGLRIGAAIVNTLADQLQIPLYDHRGTRHPVIIPEYGRPANISAPRK